MQMVAIDAIPRVVNTSVVLHQSMVNYWSRAREKKRQSLAQGILNRFERQVEETLTRSDCRGDRLIEQIREVFFNGLGIKWGEDQVRVFNAFVFSCLPLIYGDEWAENKARVLNEWNRKREIPYCVVSMARRNGKTYTTSGTVVALMLVVPEIKIAIFSTCKRTSQMMMDAAVTMLDKAFDLGTHCNRQDYIQVLRNTESIIFEGPDRTKRTLGCFPGSVRYVLFFFAHACVCVCV